MEQLLGFTKVGTTLRIAPCVPAHWPSYTLTYRYGRSTYAIEVQAPGAVQRHGALWAVDGVLMDGEVLQLADDGQHHRVVITARAPRGRAR